jgi:hypothetical protein
VSNVRHSAKILNTYFVECLSVGTQQRLVCRVSAIWHSAKKENITCAWPFSFFSHSLTLPVTSPLPAVDATAPRRRRRLPELHAPLAAPSSAAAPSSDLHARAPLPRPRPPAAPTPPPRHRRRAPVTAAPRHRRARIPPCPTPPRTQTVVAVPRPQPSSPCLALNRRRARHHAAAW